MKKTLIQELADAGLTHLIPNTYDKETGKKKSQLDEYESFMRDVNRDDEIDAYRYNNSYDNYDYEDILYYDEDEVSEESLFDNDEVVFYDEDDEDNDYLSCKDDFFSAKDDGQLDTLYDLKFLFDCTDMSDKEFLNLSMADILGITKPQLKFIDINILLTCSIEIFASIMKDKLICKEIPDVKQRIKYAMVCSKFNIYSIKLPMNHICDNDIDNYAIDLGIEETYLEEHTPENQKKLTEYIRQIIFKENIWDAIELLGFLRDYYEDYVYGKIRNIERQRNGENIVFYDLFPHKNEIKEMHDKVMRDTRTIKDRFEQINNEQLNNAIRQIIKTTTYTKLLTKDSEFSIISAESVEDLKREGKVLNSCVASYAKTFSKGESYIYFLRRTNQINTPFFTIEIIPTYNSNLGIFTYELKQCYSFNNTTEKSNNCQLFIRNWTRTHNISVNCKI